ncbi:MAG: NAD(P)H-dependent oxidoreductase [Betaproteobacteria bacterium]|nr:NAD(P)H-dependent oxidoreductase [Betaproteobacteria bacterium]
MTVHILAFAGSNRRESINRKVLNTAVQGARDAGATVTVADLRDFSMPLYDGDWHAEHGVPPALRELRKLALSANGLLIASPEYNASITPLLKNTLDWLSQDVDGESGHAPFAGKVGALLGASNGAFGTIRALPHVSYILANLGVFMLPVLAVPRAGTVLAPSGEISDERVRQSVHGLGGKLAKTIEKLSS